MKLLADLSELIRKKNEIENEIAYLIGRPAQLGHVGEYIASAVFDIELVDSASNKSFDGYFRSGLLDGKSVNIKWYGKQEGILDITPVSLPDYYLVMTGPKSIQLSSRGGVRPWVIKYVYIFEAKSLVNNLTLNKRRIGTASSVTKELWNKAEIYPDRHSALLILTQEQRQLLDLFSYIE